jgi:hypothetical protein
LYFNNSGDLLGSKFFLSFHGISHYTTAPHTPQQNGISEHHHRHVVETGLTLLHDASLDPSYWPHAFATATYLINIQPTSLLKNQTPFKVLFGQNPNYLKLRKLGCMCYPFTKAYNSNKMQSKSTPCIFLGFSQTQNAYKCLDTHSKKLYISHNVVFDESQHSLSMPHSSFPHTSFSPPTVQPGLVPASLMSYHALCPPPNLVDDAHAIIAFPLGNSTSSHHLASLDFVDTPSNHTSFPDTLSFLPPSSTAQLESSSHQFIPLPRLHLMHTQSMNQIFKPKQIFFVT